MISRVGLVISLMILASLACTLSGSDEDTPNATPTDAPIPISEARTATAIVNASLTPEATVTVLPTAIPTLDATPQQFNTPTPLSFSGGSGSSGVTTGNTSSGATSGGGGGGGDSNLVASASNPAAGAPQANGFYYPNTILFSQGGSIQGIGRDGSGQGTVVGGNQAVRSINGLFVSSAGSGVQIVRPDGTSVAQGSGQTTLVTWSSDGSVAYWGSGANLVAYQNGNAETVDTLGGNLTVVTYAPNGSGVVYASQTQIKIRWNDGNIQQIWDSGDAIIEGPYWSTYGDGLGLYFVLGDGRRLHWSANGLSDINDPNVHLQLQSPANPAARIYVRANNGNSLTLVAVYPGASDVEFVTPSLQDVSWSPDGSNLVYVAMDGNLVLLDAISGGQQVLATGGARYPVWTAPRYLVRN